MLRLDPGADWTQDGLPYEPKNPAETPGVAHKYSFRPPNDWIDIPEDGYKPAPSALPAGSEPRLGGLWPGALDLPQKIFKGVIKSIKGGFSLRAGDVAAKNATTGEDIAPEKIGVNVTGMFSLVPRPDLAVGQAADGSATVSHVKGARDGGLTPALVVSEVTEKGDAAGDFRGVYTWICLGAKPTTNWKRCDMNPTLPFMSGGVNLLAGAECRVKAVVL
jgi:hypothetical protein